MKNKVGYAYRKGYAIVMHLNRRPCSQVRKYLRKRYGRNTKFENVGSGWRVLIKQARI